MTSVNGHTLSDLIKSFGPTDEHRQKFGQTFLGTLLGQTIVFMSMMAVYVAACVFLGKYAREDLKEIHEAFGGLWLGLFFAAGPILTFLLTMLPALWRARRERRLKAATIGGDLQFKAGYFRLYPYGDADREGFKRLDGADTTILNWLRSTKASVLYLSGASGVGKSSLLAAGVLPSLRDSGWAIIQTRLFGAPVERLRAAIVEAEDLFARRPGVDLPLRDLLKKAADARRKIGAPPLLLTIDQFEEFLILHKEEEREAFATVLRDLVKNPISGLRLLLVFRSDYLPLIFKLDLPPLVAGENWQQLAPYDRGKATSFVQSGGRELSPEALDALFRGLDRIEGTPGLYRTITLNMVGLVLERMGRTLEDDPGRLIQSYLKASLAAGLSRDFARPLLASMITDAGTKEPHSEAELATLTGLHPSQVSATLVDLARQGLVRRLEGAQPVWEVAHDFLARMIGQLIGRLRPNVLQRAGPLVAPVMVLGWIAIAIGAVLYWPTWQEQASREARVALTEMGASVTEDSRGIRVFFDKAIDDKTLVRARRYLGHLDRFQSLGFEGVDISEVTNLEPLTGLSNLRTLNLYNANKITDLEPLRGLPNLKTLRFDGDVIRNLKPLQGLTNLETLSIRGNELRNLEPLRGLTKLKHLDLLGPITNLEPLQELTDLEDLEIQSLVLKDLEPLRGLTKLKRLDLLGPITNLKPLQRLTGLEDFAIQSAAALTDLEPLRRLSNLKALRFKSASIANLEPLQELTRLEELEIHSTALTNLEPLKELTKLRVLDLSLSGISSLEHLKGLKNLSELRVSSTGITSLEPLKALTTLTKLWLHNVPGITSLGPLSGRDIQIIGASPELLATMK